MSHQLRPSNPRIQNVSSSSRPPGLRLNLPTAPPPPTPSTPSPPPPYSSSGYSQFNGHHQERFQVGNSVGQNKQNNNQVRSGAQRILFKPRSQNRQHPFGQ